MDVCFDNDPDEKVPSLAEMKKVPHDDYLTMYIQYWYVIAIIMWIFLVFCFDMFNYESAISWAILVVPIVAFIFGYVNANALTGEIEDELFQSNFLSIGLIVVLPLITWVNKDYSGEKKNFTALLILAIVLTMFSVIDFWVPPYYLSLMKHIRSTFQTITIVLLIYCLYTYYVHAPDAILS